MKEEFFGVDTRIWVLLVAAVVAALNFNLLSTLQQLPSPLYGGDYWNHLGMVYHLYYGGSLFDNGQMAGEIPWVPWLYHGLVWLGAVITGMGPMPVVIWANIPLVFITTWLLYRIAARFTQNALLIAAGILPLLMFYPIFKYTDFAFLVMGPALLLAWLRYREQPGRNNMLVLAGVMVLANLTSTQLLVAGYIVLGLMGLNEGYKKYGQRWSEWVSGWQVFRPYAMVFFVSLLLSMAYWFWPIFVYHGNTPNDLFIYGWPDFSRIGEQVNFTFAVLGNWFLPAASWQGLYHLALLAGAVLLIRERAKDVQHETAYIFLVGALIGVTHHLLTYNLFGFHFDPGRPFQMLEMPLSIVQLALAGAWVQQRVKVPHLAIAFLIVTAGMYNEAYTQRKSDVFYIGARQPLPPQLAELQDWIVRNTDVNDVFLTDNEDAFMMNGLTGRKSVSYRRTHAPIYTDMNQRMLDSAVMLYGNNEDVRHVLLEQYDVRYVLWTVQWFDNQYHIGPEGGIVGFFDPFMVPYDAKYEQYLQSNGIAMARTQTYLDPAWIPLYPTYDVIVAMPASGNLFHPWNDGLDGYLHEVKRIGISDGQGGVIPFAIIYEVRHD